MINLEKSPPAALVPPIAHNPDVLSCLANLSNDEVFTPPDVANAMLDLLPQELFKSADTKFLDPVTKTGVFLREITKRLMAGLADQIPDIQKRLDHILHNQVYGIAITELTSLIARRTLYCAKYANSRYSISQFADISGNIRFKNISHTFNKNGKCVYCGASKGQYERGEDAESHAYEFIHTDNPQEIFGDMKFDVIIGNPPYQLGDSGPTASASPIYNDFIERAIQLNPRYLSMVVPARWYSGGKGLDSFRELMLKSNRIKEIHDFIIADECFPGTRIAGGVCYFLYDPSYDGDCTFYSHKNGKVESRLRRPLLEYGSDTLIRINEAIPILRKVKAFGENSFSSLVSSSKPFGLRSDFFNNQKKYGLPNISDNCDDNTVKIYGVQNYKHTVRRVERDYPFPCGSAFLDKYKVYVSQVLDNGFDWTKERLKPFLGLPNTACTETFLVVNPTDSEQEALNTISYMNTKFFHLLMFLKKVSHHVTAKVYEFVPLQDFSKPWTDAELYKKYNLSQEEIDFIEKMIKPMDAPASEKS